VWSFGEENYPILKRYMAFRERMRPYTRTLMTQAHEKGFPIIRALFYEFPGDETAWGIRDQYLYGADLLVAPVVEAGAREREVYLPVGAQWTDLHTGEVLAGGSKIRAAAPIGRIPLYLRDGAHADWIGGC
jgi:alpha-D-xyloside xylohydrolase